MINFSKSTNEQATIDWLRDLSYAYTFGPEIAFDGAVIASLRGRMSEAGRQVNGLFVSLLSESFREKT